MKPLAVVIGLVVLWAALSIVFMWPPICRYEGPSGEACLNRLRQIDGAKQQYMLETGRTNGAVDAAQIQRYLGRVDTAKLMICPCGGTITFGDLENLPACSLATSPAPPAVRIRHGLFGWSWKVWPSPGPASHKLPK